jgi:ATP-dependent protease HslVU (ClpYQ) peptidase subunit
LVKEQNIRKYSRAVALPIVVAFVQCAFAGHAVDAQRAIALGRQACSTQETALVKSGATHTRRQDWRAEKTLEGWDVMATVNGVFLTVAVSRSGRAARCEAETID